MTKALKKIGLVLCAFISFLCLVTGFVFAKPTVTASAAGAPMVEMVYGAQARKDEEKPGLRFTAKINNYDSSYTYGMLILPEAAFETLKNQTFVNHYHQWFADNDVTNYVDKECSWYIEDGERYISLSLTDIHDYTMGFVGVAYAKKGTSYTYANVNMLDNARSIAYVAQMALKSETEELTSKQRAALLAFANPDSNVLIEDTLADVGGTGDVVVEGSGNATVSSGEGHLVFHGQNLSAGKIPFITKTAYTNITEFSVDIYIPKANGGSEWFGFTPVAENSGDAYAAACTGGLNINRVNLVYNWGWGDRWVTLTYKVTGGVWQIYISRKGMDDNVTQADWTMDASGATYTANGASYIMLSMNPARDFVWDMWIDNVVIKANGVTYTDTFDTSDMKLFSIANSSSVDFVVDGLGGASIGASNNVESGVIKPEGEGHMVFHGQSLPESSIPLITQTAYTNITEFSVDVYIPSANDAAAWFGFTPVAENSGDAYAAACTGGLNLNQILVENYGWKDGWVSLTYKVTDGVWKLYLTYDKVNYKDKTKDSWTLNANNATYTANGASYVMLSWCPSRGSAYDLWIDNVVIKANGVTYTDDFNDGTSKLFTCNYANRMEFDTQEPDPEVVPYPEGEGHIVFHGKGTPESSIPLITKTAYTNIAEFSVDVYIPSTNAAHSWFGFTPVAGTSGNAYTAACTGGLNLKQILVDGYGWKGQWVSLTYKVTDGVWQLYISRKGMNDNITKANWTLNANGADYTSGGASYIMLSWCPGQTYVWDMWIDNVVIKANGATYTDDFNRKVSQLFTCKVSGALEMVYEPPVRSAETKFNEMVEAGELISHILTTQNRITSPVEVVVTENMPATMAVLIGTVKYQITDYKDVVILLSKSAENAEYLRLYNGAIVLYNGTTAIQEIPLSSASNTLKISVTASGKVLVKVNDGGYQGLGVLSGAPNAFEIVDITGDGLLTFNKLQVFTYQAKLYGSNGIDFTAYAPPPPANWDGSANNQNLITKEQYQLIKDAGFTKLLALYEGRKGADREGDTLAALALCEELGLEYYALHGDLYNYVRTYADTEQYKDAIAAMISADAEYLKSPAYAGHFVSDEPSLDELKRLKVFIELYNEIIGDNAFYGGETVVNLFPIYATETQLGGTYEEYLDYYFENLAPLLGYACYDHYPIRYEGSVFKSRKFSETHLQNLKMVAEKCKEYGVELRTFIQSNPQNTDVLYKLVNANELRIQIYSALAFGSQELVYFAYTGGLVDFETGATNTMYTWAKEVNNEVRAFGEEFVKYNWQQTYFHDVGSTNKNATNAGLADNTSLFTSTVDALVGEFERNEQKAYMLVNYTDPNNASTGTVTLKFETTQTVEIWKNGEKTTQSGKTIEVELDAGNGAFVIVK